MRIKTKLSLGTGFLFLVILLFGILSLISIYRLKNDAGSILKNNYETLIYCNNMLEALDKVNREPGYRNVFAQNLGKQELNITEMGEREVTARVKKNFNLLKPGITDDSIKILIRQDIHDINVLNQNAIFRKNTIATNTAETANNWLMIIFSILILLSFTMAVNFPGVISEPITSLNEGIRAIVNKDYRKRIHLKQKDEFGELANAFNSMAEKLDEYEHSNLAKITFEKSRIETIINQMNDGIIGLDENKHILFLNVVAHKLLGLKESEIIGEYAVDVALNNDLMRTLLQDKIKNKELKIFSENKESYFQIDALTVVNNKLPIGEVIVLRNITPFHELNEAKTNFIATVSHELKTPISAIKISLQLLADQRVGEINTEQQDLVNSINDDANRLLKITSELLNMSQVETGNIQLKIEPVSCKEIIDEAVDAVQFILQQKKITLMQEVPPELPSILADKEKTSWVLINFLTNAIKHSNEAAQIILQIETRDNKIQFKVRDFGVGMEEKYLSRIFDRYYKVPDHSASGSGLGLSIVKEFIEAQSGKVWVESKPGSGSVFGFELPISS
ncbi:MAG: ATP-binding protein [Chitinophagaceae bacterium]